MTTWLTTLDILYIVLSIFTAIIWTLLAIVLYKVIKILWPITEISNHYYSFKSYIQAYSQVPELIKQKIFDLFSKK